MSNINQTRTESALQAAKEKSMSGNEWAGNNETRIYLRRTNAARTEAGYISLYEKDGKGVSKLVITATGTGSRTCATEAESVYARYKEIRATIVAAKKAEKSNQ